MKRQRPRTTDDRLPKSLTLPNGRPSLPMASIAWADRLKGVSLRPKAPLSCKRKQRLNVKTNRTQAVGSRLSGKSICTPPVDKARLASILAVSTSSLPPYPDVSVFSSTHKQGDSQNAVECQQRDRVGSQSGDNCRGLSSGSST